MPMIVIVFGGEYMESDVALQALPYVILLIAMLFFIYAIIGMQVSSLPRSFS